MKHYKVIIRLKTETEPVYGLRPAVTVFGTFANFTRNERDAHLFDKHNQAAVEGARATGMGSRGTYKVVEIDEDDGTYAESSRPMTIDLNKSK